VDVEGGGLMAVDDVDVEGDVRECAHAQEVYYSKDGTKAFVVSRREENLIGGRGRFDVTVVSGGHWEGGGVAVEHAIFPERLRIVLLLRQPNSASGRSREMFMPRMEMAWPKSVMVNCRRMCALAVETHSRESETPKMPTTQTRTM
jgi:hypothetical protein